MSSEKCTEHESCDGTCSGQKRTWNHKPWVWGLVVMALMTVVWAVYEGSQQDGYVKRFVSKRSSAGQGNGVPLPVASSNVLPLALTPGAVGDVQTSYHGLIDTVRPAVVTIAAAVGNAPTVAGQGGVEPLPADINFNRIGSGVIIDPRGYLLSSYHVIAGAEALKATVYGPGGTTEYPLKMVKGDLRSDLALLRIQGGGPFPYAKLGNSDAARTGDMVLTIGSPYGFEQTVTSGMISSRNRTVQAGDIVYENLIQTDSALNSGSSGGPMLNMRGEIIGINTAIFAPTGVFNGIGFAIPVNRAAGLVGGVIDFNNSVPGAAGGQLVAWSSQGRQVGNNYHLPNGQLVIAPHGPLGTCVDCHPQLFEPQGQPGTAQQVALNNQGRLSGNSFILSNGLTVTPPHTLRGLCTNCHQLTFLEKQAQLQAAAPAAFIAPNGAVYGPGSGRGGGFGRGQQMAVYTDPYLGVAVVDVDDVICRQARMLHPEGVLVTSVVSGKAAAAAGIQQGDILLRVAGRKIQNSAGLIALLAAQSRTFELVYMRNGSRQSTSIKTGVRNPP